MRRPLNSLLLLGAACAAQADGHVLEIEAGAASATVAPGDVRRNSLRLPALEYVFTLTMRCADPFLPVSLSLTVADSRRAIDAEALAENGDSTELRLTVPASQLAPVPVAGFCAGGAGPDGDDAPRELLLQATLSVGASLTCATTSAQEITYASAPLDVLVNCEVPEETVESD